ncbi:phosphoribosyltransferase family protein [Arthrobacter sp. H35-D1]|uniref:ComF family protein n=1 Tax=Arthrobacter sp. H35-D1 TaxID=3046202 RepID=UPI0024B9464D|nr:phosphoribosyltransferase family protein [Arthrobacter sp. H35-D1]MDJ0315219.1 phosphoribosyltransferase family protein [Arthrobacter sp. H35-D1]
MNTDGDAGRKDGVPDPVPEEGMPPPRARHRGRPNSPWLRFWLWCEQAWRDFLDLLMPAECVVCGCEDQALCPACAAMLRRQTSGPFRAEHSADALVGVFGESHVPVIAAGEYRDALAAAILAFKNHGRTELCAPLCRGLAMAIAPALAQLPLRSPQAGNPLWLVPVPSSGNGWRRRGYDPVALILRTLVREGRLPAEAKIVPALAIRVRLPWHRQHQKGLGRAGRRRNVHNTMKYRRWRRGTIRLKAKPSGQEVLLVDDVLTTGSTLREGAKTLHESGFRVCGAVVLAAARAPEHGREKEVLEGLAENWFHANDE